MLKVYIVLKQNSFPTTFTRDVSLAELHVWKKAHFHQCWQNPFIKPCWHSHCLYLEIKIMQIGEEKIQKCGV